MKTVHFVTCGIVALVLAVAGYRHGMNEAAPDVAYTRLDGSTSTTGTLRGKVVLVSFWATSCGICIQEMPRIVATHRMFKDRGFETLAVAMSP